ncbi:hypothetical protein GGI15_000390 [Coemansia interrupta]|uniref:Fibronectin type-III domain-containing protein n=1 Tax=Coemansia interrupta TaxID=1126814 RepID=A0A9W8LPV5_9FUNG|nr:hypothetical protein GGI15_000390 [Coemansia interrupta]
MEPVQQAHITPVPAPQQTLASMSEPPKSPVPSIDLAAEQQQSEVGSVEDDDVLRRFEAWWDRILGFFMRHRATSAFIVWLGIFLFDMVDLYMPAEWLVFTLFSFSVFVQAFGMSVLLFAALTVAMTVLNVATYYFVPFTTTSLFSTAVVCMLLVRGIHGLNSKGWFITAVMSVARMHMPWCKNLPEYLQEPIAAYCTSFGVLWLVYHHSRRLERLIDPLCLLLGVIPPLPPRMNIVEIHDSSVVISWVSSLNSSLFDPHDPDGHADAMLSHSRMGVRAQTGQSFHSDAASSTSETQPPASSSASHNGIGAFDAPSSSTISIGGLLTIERKKLPEARVAYYDVEVNGHIVGSCKPSESYSKIQGLRPATMYQLRLWAVSESRGRAPSLPVFVSTLAPSQMHSDDKCSSCTHHIGDSSPEKIEHMRSSIRQTEKSIKDFEATIADLKAQSEEERSKLQKEITELRAQRKAEESSRAAQKEKIREMEAQKRSLDRDKAKLSKDISDAETQRQRTLDKLRKQELQAESYLRNAESLEAMMERERQDHNQQKAELKTAIDALKAEVLKAKQKFDSLSSEQSTLSERLRHKRLALAAQEKRNADLDAQLKDAQRKRRQILDKQAEDDNMAAKLRSEYGSLSKKLEATKKQRQKLERDKAALTAAAATSASPVFGQGHPPLAGNVDQTSQKSPTYKELGSRQSIYGIGRIVGNESATTTLNYPAPSTPSHSGGVFANIVSGATRDANKHGRSSSFASIVTASTTKLPGQPMEPKKPTSQNSGPGLRNTQSIFDLGSGDRSAEHIGSGYSGAIPRHSADLGSRTFGFWDHESALPPSSAAQPLGAAQSGTHIGNPHIASSSAAIDSINLRNVSSSSNIGAGNGIAGGTDGVAFSHRLSPVSGGCDPMAPPNRLPLWGSGGSFPSSLSTTTAEASALSILKDTDLAYPTPTQPTREDIGPFGSMIGHHEYKSPQPPPPIYSMFGSGPPGLHRQTLSRVLNGTVDGTGQQQQQQSSTGDDGSHFRFNSLDLHSADRWVERDFRESGRSSLTIDRHASPSADMIAGDTRNSFNLRSATPVEQPSLVLSDDLIGTHRPLASASSAVGDQRPHVEPIGAPVRRRAGGSGSTDNGNAALSSDATSNGRNSLSDAPYPARYPIAREISHPSSFNGSLYHKRSLWDLDPTDSDKET